jgi:hypothetical protein
MSSWTSQELIKIGDAEELAIASRPPHGTLRPFVRRSTRGDAVVNLREQSVSTAPR